jgi:hypothetical protein
MIWQRGTLGYTPQSWLGVRDSGSSMRLTEPKKVVEGEHAR